MTPETATAAVVPGCLKSGIIVSTVGCAVETTPLDLDVCDVVKMIRTGGKKLRGQITQIRNRFESELALTGGDLEKAKRAVEQLKKDLPGVTWSGRFSYRAKENLLQHSGRLCADLDSLGPELETIRAKLKTSCRLSLLFLSPTGNGLKAVFRVPADASKHAGSFRAVEKHVRDLTGIQIDESCKDVARLCFMSFDPELYHNPDATELELLPEPEKPKPAFNSSGEVNLSERQRIATELLGNIDWQSETSGFCVCPGAHLHTTGHGKRDCKIEVDGVPTVHCFHNSCSGIIAGVTHELRSRIGKAEFVPTADDETIARLAALPDLEYERCREAEAKKLGCRESVLDKLVEATKPKNRENNPLQGTAVKLADVEPWPEPVNGAEILDAVAQRFENYVVMPGGAADMLALWCEHTHAFKLFQKSPRVSISAPTEECGKTTLLNCASRFCARGKRTDNMTTAVMFRLVSGQSPTILADECDKWLFTNGELVGLVQSGHEKGGTVMRCEGDSNDLREFGCYAPFALAAIGKLPSQLHSRSICIRLERAKREEIKKRSRFDLEHVEYETELNRKLARWTADNRERIQACEPKLPAHLFNRISDNWRPLFKIAEVAAGDWPRRCSDALVKLTTCEDERENLRVMLLADIQQVFTAKRMFSKDLVEQLAELKERPWPEICRGKPITERWLARNLVDFGIHPKLLRIGEENPARGYELADFGQAFSRYLADTGDLSVTPLQYEGKSPFSKCYKSEVCNTSKSDSHIGDCNTVTLEKGEQAKRGESDAPLNLEL